MITRLAFVALAGCYLVSSIQAQPQGKPRTDALGDPLPPGAIARLGTLRLKHDPGNGASIHRAVFSPDGKTVATLAGTGSLRIWDAATGKQLPGLWTSTYSDNGSSTFCAAFAFAPGGAILTATGANPYVGLSDGGGRHLIQGGALTLWDLSAAKALRELTSSGEDVQALVIADNGKTIVSVANDGTARWLDFATSKMQRTFNPAAKLKPPEGIPAEAKPQLQPHLSPDGKFLAVQVSWTWPAKKQKEGAKTPPILQPDPEAIVFDLSSEQEIWRVKSPTKDAQMRFAFAADGKRVAVALGPNKVELRNTSTGKLIASAPLDTKTTGTDYIGDLALAPDGGSVAIRGMNSHVFFWDLNDPTALRTVIPPRVDPEPSDSRVRYTIRTSGVIYVRSMNTVSGPSQCLAFSPDGKTLAVASGSDTELFDIATLKEKLPRWAGHHGPVDYLAFSTDGTRLLSNSSEAFSELLTWDAATWKQLHETSRRTPKWPNIGSVSLEQMVYTGKDQDDRFRLFDMSTGKLLAQLTVPLLQYSGARGFFAPGGKFYMLSGPDAEGKPIERLYAVPSGKLLCQLPAQIAPYEKSFRAGGIFLFGGSGVDPLHHPIAFSPNDRLVALFSEIDGLIHVCETATGKVRHRLGQKPVEGVDRTMESAVSLAFSSDSKLLASWTASDSMIRLWDVATGKEAFRMPHDEKHTFPAGACFAWSPDGRTLAVGERDIQIWELASLKVRRVLPGHEGVTRALTYSPNSRLLASGSIDRTVLIWDAVNAELPPTSVNRDELDRHWQALAGSDATRAFAVMCELTAAPQDAIQWIKAKVKPAAPVTQDVIDELITRLEDVQYKVRQKASAELLQIAERAVPTIEKVLAANPPLETRLRLQELRTKLTGLEMYGERLQAYRAVEVLERIGSAEARQVLQSYADGAPGAMLTTQAQAALARLKGG